MESETDCITCLKDLIFLPHFGHCNGAYIGGSPAFWNRETSHDMLGVIK